MLSELMADCCEQIQVVLVVGGFVLFVFVYLGLRLIYVKSRAESELARLDSLVSPFLIRNGNVFMGIRLELDQYKEISRLVDLMRREAELSFASLTLPRPSPLMTTASLLENIRYVFENPAFSSDDEEDEFFCKLVSASDSLDLARTIETAYRDMDLMNLGAAGGKLMLPPDAVDDLHRLWTVLQEHFLRGKGPGSSEPMAEIFGELFKKIKQHGEKVIRATSTSADDVVVVAIDDVAARVGSATSASIDDIIVYGVDDVSSLFDDFLSFGGLPVITVIFSSGREIKLLFEDKTSVEKAVRAFVHDVAGVGAGSAVGGAFGGVLGSVVPGLGTAVGLFIGGALGGALGRKVTDRSKFEPLNRAKEQHQDAIDRARSEIRSAALEMRRQLAEVSESVQEEAKAQILDVPVFETEKIVTLVKYLRRSVLVNLDISCRSLSQAQVNASRQLRCPHWYIRLIGFSPLAKARKMIGDKCERGRLVIRSIKQSVPGDYAIKEDPWSALFDLTEIEIVGECKGFLRDREKGSALLLRELNALQLVAVLIWARRLAKLHRVSIGRLRAALGPLLKSYESTVEVQQGCVSKFADDLREKMESFGINVR